MKPLFALLFCSQFAIAATDPRLQKIDNELSGLSNKGKFSGVVRITEKGAIIFEKSYGYADRKKKTALTADNFFDIASMTKEVTAAAVMKLVGMGKISLSDQLGTFFPGLDPQKAKITILHLITHRSGLGYPSDKDINEMEKHSSKPEEYFKIFLDKTPLENPPGAQWSYNNLAYSLLAHLIDRAAGQPFEQFVKQQFFTPLKVECGFDDGVSVPNGLGSTGSSRGKNTFTAGEKIDELGMRGCTSMVCTARGLATWSQALMSGSVFTGNDLALYFTMQGAPPEYKTPPPLYSFGWFVEQDGWLDHTGEVDGFTSSIYMDPGSQTSVILLTNMEEDGNILDHPFTDYTGLNHPPRFIPFQIRSR